MGQIIYNESNMPKTILYLAMSLDGYIAGPNEDLSWLNDYNEADEKEDDNPYAYNNFFASVGVVIMGRNTYDFEIKNGGLNMNNPVPKFILTSKPKSSKAKKDRVFTNDDIAAVLEQAKKMTNKNIWIEGGGNVAQQFIKRDLLDEMILFIVPVLLGGGVKLFGELDAYKYYKLRNVRKSGGMAQLEYIRK